MSRVLLRLISCLSVLCWVFYTVKEDHFALLHLHCMWKLERGWVVQKVDAHGLVATRCSDLRCTTVLKCVPKE
jgi:hypothetical protein